jgi:HEPN domain-containing protein
VELLNKQVDYWIEESMESLDVAKVLLDKKKYLESAFFCNLSSEKMLKAAVVHSTNQIPPKIHTLSKLAQIANIYDRMNESHKRFMNQLDVFQIEGRYPDDRKKLYETTPIDEFSKIYKHTEELILWIKLQVQS